MSIHILLRRPTLSVGSLMLRQKKKSSAPGNDLVREAKKNKILHDFEKARAAAQKRQIDLFGAYLDPPRRPITKFTVEQLDERARIAKEWTRYCGRKNLIALRVDSIRKKMGYSALGQLRRINEKLFQEAMKPYTPPYEMIQQPPLDTPPIPGYRK